MPHRKIWAGESWDDILRYLKGIPRSVSRADIVVMKRCALRSFKQLLFPSVEIATDNWRSAVIFQ